MIKEWRDKVNINNLSQISLLTVDTDKMCSISETYFLSKKVFNGYCRLEKNKIITSNQRTHRIWQISLGRNCCPTTCFSRLRGDYISIKQSNMTRICQSRIIKKIVSARIILKQVLKTANTIINSRFVVFPLDGSVLSYLLPCSVRHSIFSRIRVVLFCRYVTSDKACCSRLQVWGIVI